MPYYRGIEQTELLDSIERAHSFLNKLDLAPRVQKAINVLLGPDQTGIIGLATSNQELNYAIHESKVGFTMGMLSRIFKFHALYDSPAAPERKSEALDVYTKLAAWGAFLPKQFQVVSSIDRELDAHLLPAYAKAVTDQDEESGSEAQTRLKEYIDDARQKLAGQEGGEGIAKWLDESIPLVIGLSKMGADAEVGEVLKGNSAGAVLIPGALETVLNINQRIEDLRIENPIGIYNVSLGPMPRDEVEQKALYEPVMQEMQELMLPFVMRDEMLSTMIVFAHPQTGEGSIRVFATRDAMEYLASHLPEDMPLYDSDGQQVLPPSDGSSPQWGGSSPRPGLF